MINPLSGDVNNSGCVEDLENRDVSVFIRYEDLTTVLEQWQGVIIMTDYLVVLQ